MNPLNIPRRQFMAGLAAIFLVLIFILFIRSSFKTSLSLSTQQGADESTVSNGRYGMGIAPMIDRYSKGAPEEMMPPPTIPYPQPGAPYIDRQTIEQKIIRNADLSIRVDNAEEKFEHIKGIATQYQGFIANAQLNDQGGTKNGSFVLRIPNKNLDVVMAAIKKISLVVFSESSNTSDVTAQYIDLDARLKAARAEETQYLEILKQARTIEDTLKVTAQLSEVRSRIEQLQGQLRFLSEQTDYSTLNVQLTEETRLRVPTRTWRPLETIRQAFSALIMSLQSLIDIFLTAVIFIAGYLIPVLLGLYFLYWIGRKIWKKMK